MKKSGQVAIGKAGTKIVIIVAIILSIIFLFTRVLPVVITALNSS